MSLALLGFGMIATFMALIMGRVLSAVLALVLVPLAFGLLAGHRADLADMAIGGMSNLAPTAAALVFAVLYFSVMIDAGLFDPLVRGAVRFAKGDPVRVTLATTAVAVLVSLDGDGATTAIVTIGAFLPIYRRLGMNPLILAVILGSANSIINIMPWGGPTARVASALQVAPTDIFVPLLPTMAAGLAGTFVIAWLLGRRERSRLGVQPLEPDSFGPLFDRPAGVERPRMFWLNLALTLALLVCAVLSILPLPLLMMVAFSIAAVINYPKISSQRERIAAHAANALPIALLVFSAGVFTGILGGTGMVDAMGRSLLSVTPESLGPFLGPVIAVMSGPFTFIMSNDAYYFGIVPVVAETAGHFGLSPAEVARASLLGQTVHALSPLIAAIYLVAGLLKVEVGDLQRFGLPYAIALQLIMTIVALATGAVPLIAAGG
jgi:CitMHS family citrate-Mg2+:H+ or citrate-Ca2+:H+ symporter